MKGAKAAKTAFWLGIGSTVIGALAAYGTGWGLWHFIPGLLGVVAAVVLALVAVIAGLIALVRKPAGLRRHAVIGLIATLPILAVAGWAIGRGTSNPQIHEVTTNLADVPQFQTLKVREDRFLGLDGGEPEWRSIHAQALGDLKPMTLPVAPAEALAKAKAIASARGWEIAAERPDAIEATATVSPFKFKDDIVIRVLPDATGSRIDIRSISRVGIGDLGLNAERIREVQAALRQ